MGAEYEGIKLTDIYNKANPNKIAIKYGKSLIMSLAVTHEGEPICRRTVKLNPDYKAPEISPEEELEEERMLDD
jgi:hypothetical protein